MKKIVITVAKNAMVVIIVACLVLTLGCNGGFGSTQEPTDKPTETVTNTPTVSPSLTPTPTVTPKPSPTDTLEPTVEPTVTVTQDVTVAPTPTKAVTTKTNNATKKPARTPTPAPSPHPTPDVAPTALFNALVNPYGNTIGTRFNVPAGFVRVPAEKGSFAEYLRNLPLKADGSQLHYLNANGSVSTSLVPYDEYHAPAAHAAILDISMLSNSEQCADTVMHLYSNYLFDQGRYDEMSFTFVNRFVCDFRHYMSGYRYNANTAQWTYNSDNAKGATKTVLNTWLRHVFSYANTASLVRYDLDSVKISQMQIGDMFIQERTAQITTGHVVLICDMIQNPSTGEVRFMTLQGSMPALEAHVMLNAKEQAMSPWQNTRFPDGKFISATYWSCDISKLSRFKTQGAYGNIPEVVIPSASPTPSISVTPDISATVGDTATPNISAIPSITASGSATPDITVSITDLTDASLMR